MEPITDTGLYFGSKKEKLVIVSIICDFGRSIETIWMMTAIDENESQRVQQHNWLACARAIECDKSSARLIMLSSSDNKKRIELGIFKTRKPIKDDEDGGERVTKKASVSREGNDPSSSKSSDQKKQSLFARKKKPSECFAEARVDKRMFSKETTQKTIVVAATPFRVVHEKVSLTIQQPENAETNQSLSDDSGSSTVDSSNTCAQLVEQKLQEITQEVENLAAVAAAKTAPTTTTAADIDEPRIQRATSEVSTSSVAGSAEGYRTPDQSLRIEIATPPIVKPRHIFPSPNPSLHLSSTASETDSRHLHHPHHPLHHHPIIPPPVPPKTTDLKTIAEVTQRLINEATTGTGMQRISHTNSEKNHETLADRLSKGIHDLTQGSSDRLQRWKTKLQNGNHARRHKDQSEPPPTRRPAMRVDADTVSDWSDRYPPRPLHPSRSASNALQINHLAAGHCFGREGMDHRTLKNRENSVSQKDLSFHYQHMNSLQNIMNTLDGYTKNNFDNMPPRILPFSGVKPATDGLIRPVAFRPLVTQNDDPSFFSTNAPRLERQVIRGDSTKSATNMSSLISTQMQKSRAMFQPSTSFTSQKPQENEYDTVPDFTEKEKMSDFGSSVSDYGSYHHVHQPTKMTSSTLSSGTHSSGSQLSSPPSTNKKGYASSGRVSAVHVTPSPSDSGIVDYETLIRDKENELRVVRNTMEQNEEIIVKVYQEKERAWKEELEHLRSRLSASEKGENALRAQLAGCQKQTDNMSRTIDGLRDEKTGLLRKCFQLERELSQLKMELDKPKECDECRQRSSGGPLSRRTQDSDGGALRGEVASLRDEVATLKEALTAQMQVFSDERKKWEREARSESSQVSIGRDRLI
ncbi:hypothetical protein Q1695_001231 [Nippostrongylus brasiliensis]|nr:hypothetical protein Q1695_001231 [Nippostrongylus brasiliensis]